MTPVEKALTAWGQVKRSGGARLSSATMEVQPVPKARKDAARHVAMTVDKVVGEVPQCVHLYWTRRFYLGESVTVVQVAREFFGEDLRGATFMAAASGWERQVKRAEKDLMRQLTRHQKGIAQKYLGLFEED